MSRHLGLDLGGTSVKWAVLEDGEVVKTGRAETLAAEGPEAVIGRLIAAGREAGRVDTVGIGVPGLFDETRKVTTFLPNFPGDWDGRPVPEQVGGALGAPARLINDARAFALAEWALGAARGCDTAAFFVVGTGVGGGIVVGGLPHRAGRAARASSGT